MARATKTSVEGLRETQKALAELPLSTRRNLARRVLMKAGKPIIDNFQQRAPRFEGHLADSGAVSTKLSKRQARTAKKLSGASDVVVYAGPGPDPAAIAQEFGNINHPAQPALTPAWEGEKRKSLKIIVKELKVEIKKAADRAARKLIRLGR